MCVGEFGFSYFHGGIDPLTCELGEVQAHLRDEPLGVHVRTQLNWISCGGKTTVLSASLGPGIMNSREL